MKRVMTLVGMLMLVPALAAGQTPPKPAAPPPPPAPAQPAPRAIAEPVLIDQLAFEEAVRAAQQVDVDAMRAQARAAAERAREAVRVTMPEMRMKLEDMRMSAFDLQERSAFTFWQDSGEGDFSSGLSQMNQRQYDRAITYFDRAIAQKSARADGALYWKAYCQFKLAKSDDAIATLAILRKDYPQSHYLGDAKLLEADARRRAGQPANANDATDEEMKLLAMQGLMNSDPDKAIPLVEGLLSATNSLAMKKKCIYVLALSDRPRAHQTLLSYAKGNGNPDLQMEAIKYLATRRNQTTTSTELKEIYEATQDLSIRRAIIAAYQSNGNKTELFTIASGSSPVEIRRSAISGLGNLATPPELWALYQKEEDKDLRSQMVSVCSSMGAVDQLTQVAKTDKDPGVRIRAIRSLGNQRIEKTGQTLVELYGASGDKDTRLAIISALGNQSNAEGLIGVVRKEPTPELQREIVRRLADMAPKSKVAADYLAEIIKKVG